jgi:D-arabinitol dehydrogenase (NADP+)
VLRAGICGTDLHLHDGEFGPTYPLTPGHEIAGEVADIGTEVLSLKIGQRVVIDNCYQCGECAQCRRKLANFCHKTVAQGVNAQGGFAEFIIARENRCFVVDDLDLDVAVFAEPVACVVHGLDQLALAPGSRVLIFGAGPTGLILAQLISKNSGSDLTVAAPTKFKLDIAIDRGATKIVQIDRKNVMVAIKELSDISPDGFDVVIDATGSLDILNQAIKLTRTGGMIFVYGMTSESAKWEVSPYEIFRRELTIKGSFAQAYSFDRALSMLRSGDVDTSDFITHRFGLHDYAEALKMTAASSCIKAIIEPLR